MSGITEHSFNTILSDKNIVLKFIVVFYPSYLVKDGGLVIINQPLEELHWKVRNLQTTLFFYLSTIIFSDPTNVLTMVTMKIAKIEELEGVSMKMRMKKVVHLIIIEDLLPTLVGVTTTIAKVRLVVTEDL